MIITAKMIWYQCCEIKYYKYAAELKYFHLLTLKKKKQLSRPKGKSYSLIKVLISYCTTWSEGVLGREYLAQAPHADFLTQKRLKLSMQIATC